MAPFKGVNALSDLIDKMDESTLSANTEILMCLLYYRPTFSDINFQVATKTLLIAQKIAYHSTQFTYRHAAYVIEGLCEKLIDAKLKKSTIETFDIFSEVLGPQTIFSLLYKYTGNHRNPKVTSEALLYMTTAIQEFGLHTIDIKSLMEFVKVALDSTNPHIKHSAVALLTEVYKWTGVGLRESLKDVKPTLLNIIDQEFAKIAGTKPATPTRHVRSTGLANVPPQTTVSKFVSNTMNFTNTNTQKEREKETEKQEKCIYTFELLAFLTSQLLFVCTVQMQKKKRQIQIKVQLQEEVQHRKVTYRVLISHQRLPLNCFKTWKIKIGESDRRHFSKSNKFSMRPTNTSNQNLEVPRSIKLNDSIVVVVIFCY